MYVVLMVLLTVTLKLKVNTFTSYILPTRSLASSGSTAIPEVVSAVEVWLVSLSQPLWSPPPTARVGRGQPASWRNIGGKFIYLKAQSH